MPSVQVSIDIAAPIETVWELAMDPQRTLDWVTVVRGVSDVDEGPLRRGFRMKQQMTLRNVPFSVQWELVDLDVPRYARWHGKGPARSTAVIVDRLTAVQGGSRFNYFNDFKAPFGVLGSVASRTMVGGIPEAEARESLDRLKALAEAAAGIVADAPLER